MPINTTVICDTCGEVIVGSYVALYYDPIGLIVGVWHENHLTVDFTSMLEDGISAACDASSFSFRYNGQVM